jgi:hypothetical protein
LVVGQPQPVSARPIPNFSLEVAAVCEYFPRERIKVLSGLRATAQVVRDHLEDYGVAFLLSRRRRLFPTAE